MTKEEKIKEAWAEQVGEDRFESLKEELIHDGWLHFAPIALKKFETRLIDDALFYRPLSLRGIENNNGWFKIESSSDLPKEEAPYWCVVKGEIIDVYRQTGFIDNNDFWWINNVTHYQPITKPKPPVY